MSQTIYVLQCQNGKYYVGRTSDINTRLNQHFNGNGSAWTSMHKPIRVIETIPNCDQFDEDPYVLRYMNKYGTDNVRGGSYSQIQLDDKQKSSISRQLNNAGDRCFTCGQAGHFSRDCPQNYGKKKVFQTQPSNGLWQSFVEFGQKIFQFSEDDEDEDEDENRCYRCGRQGHYYAQCYAQTNINGKKLRW